VLQKLYGNGVLLGDTGPGGWGIEYATEFHMTGDSKLFAPRHASELEGYRPDEYGHWLAGGWHPYSGPKGVLERDRGVVLSRDGRYAIAIAGIEGVALPLVQGAMVHQFDCWAAQHVSGSAWRAQAWGAKQQAPQWLIDAVSYRRRASAVPGLKFGFRSIARATDTRTIIGALLDDVPCGNALGVLSCREADRWHQCKFVRGGRIAIATARAQRGSPLGRRPQWSRSLVRAPVAAPYRGPRASVAALLGSHAA
jgi:hypothetical protein